MCFRRYFGTTEIYSFGKCWRELTGWPNWLPFPVYSDHGNSVRSVLHKHEMENLSRYHMVWFDERYQKILEQGLNNTIIHVQNPWISYREKRGISQKGDHRGTLVYFSKTSERTEYQPYDYDEYFKSLMSLPDKYHPLVICMHMHDINKNKYHELRKYNIPIVTAGNSLSKYFVDRFYDIASNFTYATSTIVGSHAFYAHDLGLQFFLYGKKPVLSNISDPNYAKGTSMLDCDPLSVDVLRSCDDCFHIHLNLIKTLRW